MTVLLVNTLQHLMDGLFIFFCEVSKSGPLWLSFVGCICVAMQNILYQVKITFNLFLSGWIEVGGEHGVGQDLGLQ